MFTLDPSAEQVIADSIRHTESGAQLVLEPGVAQELLEGTREQAEQMASLGYMPVALCSPRVQNTLSPPCRAHGSDAGGTLVQ